MTAKEAYMLTVKSKEKPLSRFKKRSLISHTEDCIRHAAKNGDFSTDIYTPSTKEMAFICKYLIEKDFKVEVRTAKLAVITWGDVLYANKID